MDFTRRTLDELVALQEAIYQAQQTLIEVQNAGAQISITPPKQNTIILRVGGSTTNGRSVRFQ
ncbi:MAG: hypothetical protein KME15_19905 [Drouetiella hepatica Uher 2000/2452]|jgi:hypothetical protein|uniref:Uncharacterized protein n=1 Tax=Drouetiella hepatica Uher 2000/2452 TaxID=904376 RepID=A0A951QFG9_9CYAN|nr:hypothetical protein [Drouetiella hepatica Uher 2000/2452]